MSNPYLVNMLQSTGNKTLVEACYDKLWGTEIPLRDKDCLKEEQWTNIGIQGEILMEIRETSKASFSVTPMDTISPIPTTRNEITSTDAGSQDVTN